MSTSGAPGPPVLPQQEVVVKKVLFSLPWRVMCQILLALPVAGIFVCLITSMIFHSDHINNTVCKVYNFLPSISAVTGVSPQRYLWRVAVALHISPRLLVAFVSKSHYESLGALVSPAKRPAFQSLVKTAFYLNLVELATLCGVTYISNKENYPVHEKFFTLFMMVSLVYMLVVVRVFSCVQTGLSPAMKRSFLHKKCIFGLKLAATVGLMFFFYRHRVYCLPKAFSWFSLCEYVIATCNMLYHVSVALDFSEHDLIVGQIVFSPAAQNAVDIEPSAANTSDVRSEAELDNDAKTESSTLSSDKAHAGQSSPNSKLNEIRISTSGLVEDSAREEKGSVSNDVSANSVRKRVLSNVDEADLKMNNAVSSSAYTRLNSSSESVSKLHDHESPTASSEFLPSSSVTSSLSRSTSGFSADSSSVGISESVSLEAIYSRNKQEIGDTMNDRLLDEEGGDSHLAVQIKDKIGAEDLKRDGVMAPVYDFMSNQSGAEDDTENKCTNPFSPPAHASNSGSSDLSDEANSSLTLRQTRNEIPQAKASCARGSEPVEALNPLHSSHLQTLPPNTCVSSHSDNPVISSQVTCTISTVSSAASSPSLSCPDTLSSSQLHQRFRNQSSGNDNISSSSIIQGDDNGRLESAPFSAQSSVEHLPNMETDPTSRAASISAVDEKAGEAHKE